MFTGIIQALGEIADLQRHGDEARLSVDAGRLDVAGLRPGDSIAVNGVCLTAVEVTERGFTADVSGETLAHTTLGRLTRGAAVNLEPALTPTTALGGHLVSGHVDDVGEVVERRPHGDSVRLRIEVPARLARYIAAKGSVAVDGVSLTVNDVDGPRFGVNVIPHTLEHTTLGACEVASPLNIEVDLVARYLERLVLGEQAASASGGLTLERLRELGFIEDA